LFISITSPLTGEKRSKITFVGFTSHIFSS
jgi:hypothetical protein